MKEWFKKYWLHSLIVVIILTIIFKLVIKPKGNGEGGGNDTANGGFSPSPTLDIYKTLSLGTIGAEVGELQRMINNAYVLMGASGKIISVDDSFGNATQTALFEVTGQNSITLSQASQKYQSIFGSSVTSSTNESCKGWKWWVNPLCPLNL